MTASHLAGSDRAPASECGEDEVSGTTNQLRFPPEATPLLLDYDSCNAPSPASGKYVVYMDGHVAALHVLGD